MKSFSILRPKTFSIKKFSTLRLFSGCLKIRSFTWRQSRSWEIGSITFQTYGFLGIIIAISSQSPSLKGHRNCKTMRMFWAIYQFSNTSHTTLAELINSWTKISRRSETNNLRKLIFAFYSLAFLMTLPLRDQEWHSYIISCFKIE